MDIQRFNKIIDHQQRRGFDKYLLAPFLLWVGIRSKSLPKKIRRLLVAAGVFQIFYSWSDYIELQAKIVEAANNAKQPKV